MCAQAQEPSTRRVMWWARSFGRPLQATFSELDQDTPEDFSALLEKADQRLGQSQSQRDS
jgi:hypothetical protein